MWKARGNVAQMDTLSFLARLMVKGVTDWLDEGFDYDGATFLLDRVAPESQDHPDMLALRQRIHALAVKRWNTAFDLARRHIRANPGDPKGWLYQSWCARQLKLLASCQK